MSLWLSGLLLITYGTLPALAISGGTLGKHWVASKGVVLIDNIFNRGNPSFCMGALLHERIVLTLANCTQKYFNRTTVFVGSTTPFEADGQIFVVDGVGLVGQPKDKRFQLALLRLNRPVDFNPYAATLALPSKHSPSKAQGQVLRVFGYGSIDLDEPSVNEKRKWRSAIYQRFLSDKLMTLEYPHLKDSACDKFFHRPELGVPYKVQCFGYTKNRLKRLMPDDHGAPIIGTKDNVLYGIAVTNIPFKSDTINWNTTSFPQFVVHVYSQVPQILEEMKRLQSYK